MARSRYEIAIEAKYQGNGAKEAEKDFRSLDSSVESAGDKVKKYGAQAAAAGALVIGFGIAAKEAYEFIGEGAALTAAAGKFDNLAVSINTTGDALLGKMKEATKGLISDADLIAAGTDIMSLGLAKTEGGVVRMAAAVGALNLDMGVLALTLANDSTARLDSLGLSLEAVTARKKELIASGFIGDAFDEAVLIELEQKMTLLGDASETTAGKMQILEAKATNLFDKLKEGTANSEALNGALDTWLGLMTAVEAKNEAVTRAQDDMRDAVARGIITQEGANTIVKQAARGDELYIRRLAEVREELAELEKESSKYTNTAEEVNAMMAEREAVTQAALIADEEHIEKMRDIVRVNEEMTDKQRQANQLLSENEAITRSGNAALRDAIAAEEEQAAALQQQIELTRVYGETIAGLATDALEPMEGATIDYKNALLDEAAALGVTQQQMVLMAQATGDYTEEQIEAALESAIMAQAVKDMAQAVSDGDVTVSGALEGLASLQAELDGSSQSADALTGSALSAADAIDNIPENVNVTFTSDLSGFNVPSGFAAAQASSSFGGGVPEFADGGSFTVPPGFPNDSFPMLVQSGEHVQVTPAGQRPQGSGVVNNYYANTREAAALMMAGAMQSRRQGNEERMI